MQHLPVAQSHPLPTPSLHAWLNRLGWPRSYAGKFFVVALIANLIPLLTVGTYLALQPHALSAQMIFVLASVATVVGATVGFFAVRSLLMPILQVHDHLSSYLDTGKMPEPLHVTADDEAGTLVRNLNYALATFDAYRKQMQQESQRDFLTGLLNRRAADARLSHLTRSMTTTPFDVCIALIDLDNFKRINDQFGHQVGDDVLQRVTKAMSQRLRGTDWIARWGGDELVVAVQADPEGAAFALERLRKDVEELEVPVKYRVVPVTVSIGFTSLRAGEAIDDAMRRADNALYMAKKGGRNRVSSVE